MNDYQLLADSLNLHAEQRSAYVKSIMEQAAAAIRAQAARISKMEIFLLRLREWDHLSTAADGLYWQSEIDKVLLDK